LENARGDMVIVGYDGKGNPITEKEFATLLQNPASEPRDTVADVDEQGKPILFKTQSDWEEMMSKIPTGTQASDTQEIPWYRQRKPDERSLRDILTGWVDGIPSPEEIFGEDPRAAGAAARERFFPAQNEAGVLEIPITTGQTTQREPAPISESERLDPQDIRDVISESERLDPQDIRDANKPKREREIDWDALAAFLSGGAGQTSIAGALAGGTRGLMAEKQRREEMAAKREGLQLQREELEIRRELMEEENRLRALADLYPSIAAEAEAAWAIEKAKLEKEAGKGFWNTDIFWRSEAEAIEASKIQFMNDYIQNKTRSMGLGGKGTVSEAIQDFSSYNPS